MFRATLRHSYGDLPAGSPVAIKRYKPWLFDERGALERVLRELQVSRELDHPNLVKALSVVMAPDSGPALVMRFYDGEPLDQRLARSRRTSALDPREVATIVGGVAAALQALQSHGAIHRDVKPANIVLTAEGPVLMDLGVVRSESFPEQTTTGAFLGTIRYADPAYLLGESCGSEIDIYSLGLILYECVTRHEPYPGVDNWASVIQRKLIKAPLQLLPEELDWLTAELGVWYATFVNTTFTSCVGLREIRRDAGRIHADMATMVQGWPADAPYGPVDYSALGISLPLEGREDPLTGAYREKRARQLAQALRKLPAATFDYLLAMLRTHFWSGVHIFEGASVNHSHATRLYFGGALGKPKKKRGDTVLEFAFTPVMRDVYRMGLLDKRTDDLSEVKTPALPGKRRRTLSPSVSRWERPNSEQRTIEWKKRRKGP